MKKTSLKALLGASASALVLSAAAPAMAGGPLEEPVADKEFVEVGSFRGSILLPGTGISFKVGGYAKGDFIYTFEDFSASELSTQNGTAGQLGASGEFSGTGGDRARFHALQSRLNFDARTTTDLGSARAFIELDLFAGEGSELVSNSINPRLRHAFVELGFENLGGSLLFGQTWSNFGDLTQFPNTLDFGGPDSAVFKRLGQIRWTQPLTDAVTLFVAAENPEFRAEGNAALGLAGVGGNSGLDSVPDFTTRLTAKTGIGQFSLSGLFRYLDPDNGDSVTTTDTTFAWGVYGQATINVFEKDKFNISVGYGQGVGAFTLNVLPEAFIASDGSLETIDYLFLTSYYQHFWSDKLQSNLAFGYATSDELDAFGTELDSEIYVAGNLIYSPRSNINLGAEITYEREQLSTEAEARDGFRFQTSIQFSF